MVHIETKCIFHERRSNVGIWRLSTSSELSQELHRCTCHWLDNESAAGIIGRAFRGVSIEIGYFKSFCIIIWDTRFLKHGCEVWCIKCEFAWFKCHHKRKHPESTSNQTTKARCIRCELVRLCNFNLFFSFHCKKRNGTAL